MHSKSLLVMSLLAVSAVAVPTKRAEKGLNSQQNVAITDDERARLAQLTPAKRGLEARGLTKMNCGHMVTGDGGANGHGKWVPVPEFKTQAKNFCDAYIGTDVAPGHETSDTYPTSLTNQGDDTKKGDDAFIVFAVYNQGESEIWRLDADTCYQALLFPLGEHARKRSEDGVEYVELGKRDDCWGHKHNDFEGGYTKVDDWLAIGSEVHGKK